MILHFVTFENGVPIFNEASCIFVEKFVIVFTVISA